MVGSLLMYNINMTRINRQQTTSRTHSLNLVEDSTKTIREVDGDGIERTVNLVDEISIMNNDERPLTFIVEHNGVVKVNVTVAGKDTLSRKLGAREQFYNGENLNTYISYGS